MFAVAPCCFSPRTAEARLSSCAGCAAVYKRVCFPCRLHVAWLNNVEPLDHVSCWGSKITPKQLELQPPSALVASRIASASSWLLVVTVVTCTVSWNPVVALNCCAEVNLEGPCAACNPPPSTKWAGRDGGLRNRSMIKRA